MDIYSNILYSQTAQDITNYFRPEVMAQKTVENAASDGFWCNLSRTIHARITKFHTLIVDNRPHKTA